MSSSPPDSSRPPGTPLLDRRAPRGAEQSASPLRQLKGMLDRPIRFATDQGRLRVEMVERRKAPADDQAYLIAPLRAEIKSRLLSNHQGTVPAAMRHLKLVHKQLGSKGWSGMDALSARVLAKARDQVEMLNGATASPLLELLIERLRASEAAAVARDQARPSAQKQEAVQDLEVLELSQEEFEEAQRSWA